MSCFSCGTCCSSHKCSRVSSIVDRDEITDAEIQKFRRKVNIADPGILDEFSTTRPRHISKEIFNDDQIIAIKEKMKTAVEDKIYLVPVAGIYLKISHSLPKKFEYSINLEDWKPLIIRSKPLIVHSQLKESSQEDLHANMELKINNRSDLLEYEPPSPLFADSMESRTIPFMPQEDQTSAADKTYSLFTSIGGVPPNLSAFEPPSPRLEDNQITSSSAAAAPLDHIPTASTKDSSSIRIMFGKSLDEIKKEKDPSLIYHIKFPVDFIECSGFIKYSEESETNWKFDVAIGFKNWKPFDFDHPEYIANYIETILKKISSDSRKISTDSSLQSSVLEIDLSKLLPPTPVISPKSPDESDIDEVLKKIDSSPKPKVNRSFSADHKKAPLEKLRLKRVNSSGSLSDDDSAAIDELVKRDITDLLTQEEGIG